MGNIFNAKTYEMHNTVNLDVASKSGALMSDRMNGMYF